LWEITRHVVSVKESGIKSNFLHTYYKILEGFRTQAAVAGVLWAICGFFEGLALLTLIPTLTLGFGEHTPQGSSFVQSWTSWVVSLGLSQNTLLTLGLGTFLGLVCTSEALRFFTFRKIGYLCIRLEETLRGKFTAATLKMRWLSFQKYHLGDLTKGLLVEGRETSIGVHALLQALGEGLMALTLLGVAFMLSWSAALLTLVFTAVFFGINQFASRRLKLQPLDLSRLSSS